MVFLVAAAEESVFLVAADESVFLVVAEAEEDDLAAAFMAAEPNLRCSLGLEEGFQVGCKSKVCVDKECMLEYSSKKLEGRVYNRECITTMVHSIPCEDHWKETLWEIQPCNCWS